MKYAIPEGAIALGYDHWLSFSSWHPDRSIPENARRFAGVPDVERFAGVVYHKTPTGEGCIAAIHFDGDVARLISPKSPKWAVEQWEPLTVSPSLLCGCGDHGFIRSGKWVPA